MLDSDGGGTIDPEEFKQTLTRHLEGYPERSKFVFLLSMNINEWLKTINHL